MNLNWPAIYNATLLLLSLLFMACGSEICFTEPQPAHSKNLSAFPASMLGRYLFADEDSTTIFISDKCIEWHDYKREKCPMSESDSLFIIMDSLIYKAELPGKPGKYRIENDTLYVEFDKGEKYCLEHEDMILRKLRSDYFVSFVNKNSEYSVYRIRQAGSELMYGMLTEDDRVLLETATGTKRDTTKHYLFSPTRRQFKKFIRLGGFSTEIPLIRLK